MNAGNIPIVKFMFEQDLRVLNEALSASPSYESERITSAGDLTTYLTTVSATLIIASLKSKEDFVQIASFMKLIKKTSKNAVFKIAVFNFSGDQNFAKAINKLGIQDLIEPTISAKGLKFKIDFWMKALKAQAKNLPQSNGPQWKEALELEDDIWILKTDSDCKKVLNKWLIRLMGPAPFVAQWNEVKPNLWRFDFKDEEKEMYVGGEGAWFFQGDSRPDFVWKENIWLITGDQFELYFKSPEQTFSRLNCKNKVLTICKNSLFAKTKESMILESLNKEMVFKQETEKLQDLEGKNSTDHLAGHLSGEAEGSTSTSNFWKNKNQYQSEERPRENWGFNPGEEAGSDNLERERKDGTHQKHYKNHNEAEAYEAGNLSGKLGPSKKEERPQENWGFNPGAESSSGNLERERKDGAHQKHYKNHNEAEAYEAGSLSGKLEPSKKEERPQENWGFNPGAESASGNLERERKDSAHQKHYKNHNEAEKYEAGDLSGKSGASEKLDGFYRGQELSEAQKAQEESLRQKLERIQKERKDRAARKTEDTAWSEAEKAEEQQLAKAEALLTRKLNALESGRKLELVLPPEERSLEEITRDTEVTSYLLQENRKVLCRLDDYFDGTFIFLTEQIGIRPLVAAKLDMTFNDSRKNSHLNLEAEVLTVEDDGEGNNYITLKIDERNTDAIQLFIRLFEIRQDNINEFLKKARGY